MTGKIPERCDYCGKRFSVGDTYFKHSRLNVTLHAHHDLTLVRGEDISMHCLSHGTITAQDVARHATITEDQFPLGEEHVEPFPVIVMWHDQSESPSQAIARLNAEAINAWGDYAPINDVVYREASRHGMTAMVDAARLLCGDTPEVSNPEYARGVAEVILDTLNMGTGRREDLVAWLCSDSTN